MTVQGRSGRRSQTARSRVSRRAAQPRPLDHYDREAHAGSRAVADGFLVRRAVMIGGSLVALLAGATAVYVRVYHQVKSDISTALYALGGTALVSVVVAVVQHRRQVLADSETQNNARVDGATQHDVRADPMPEATVQPSEVEDEPEPTSSAWTPVVLDGTTSAGRAPWHLPTGVVPNGLAADAVRLGSLDVRAVSIVGASHRCEEPAVPRQDAYALARSADGQYLVVAVADGVANSKRSDLGARVAVSAAVRLLVRHLDGGGTAGTIEPSTVFRAVAGEMLGTGRSRELDASEIASVLIVAVIPTVAAGGQYEIWTARVGDCSIWSLNGHWTQLTGSAKSGLDKNLLTAALPHDPDQAEVRMLQLTPDSVLAVMSDGVGDTLSDVQGANTYFAREWGGKVPTLPQFIHTVSYDAPGQLDDRTVVVVWPRIRSGTGQAPR
ncbi:protein phosphatase 2C domain-containing protein [Kribbella sp. NPDC051586]|uniref:protein phosphatase 2C domain-containing protein n=1 Tax=Kribbella sp. NPDC051586 TaxID=3364118 RepID=UPI00378D1300